MKKTAAFFLALLLILNICAFALDGSKYPAWDGASTPANSLCGHFDQHALKLDFDPAADYSSVQNGLVQACFYTFDGNRENYLEFYFLLPVDLQAGGVYTPANLPEEASIFLYEVSKTNEDLYFAGIYDGAAFPGETGFEIRIDEMDRSASSLHIRGSFDARLAMVSDDYKVIGSLVLSDMHFDFTLPLNGAPAPAATPSPDATAPADTPKPFAPATPEPAQDMPQLPLPTQAPTPPAFAAPQPTLDPHPAFTLPPDYRVL